MFNMKQYLALLIFLAVCSELFSQNTLYRLDSLFKNYYKKNEPGATSIVESRDKIIFKKSYGISNLQTGAKITSTTNFNIGSLTKQFTAYAILLFEHQRMLSLQDKL